MVQLCQNKYSHCKDVQIYLYSSHIWNSFSIKIIVTNYLFPLGLLYQNVSSNVQSYLKICWNFMEILEVKNWNLHCGYVSPILIPSWLLQDCQELGFLKLWDGVLFVH